MKVEEYAYVKYCRVGIKNAGVDGILYPFTVFSDIDIVFA